MAEYPYNRSPLRPAKGDGYDSASRLDEEHAIELTTNGQEQERYRDEDEPVSRNRELRPVEKVYIKKQKEDNDG